MADQPRRVGGWGAQAKGRDADPATPASGGQGAHDRALDFVHASAMQHVVLADRKAGILFTLLSAALLFLFTRMPAFAWPLTPSGWLWLAAVAFLVAATTLAFLVVLPRVRMGRSADVLFWGAVAQRPDVEAYEAALHAMTPAELSHGKAVHCYQLSCICRSKFRLVRVALLLAAAGLVLFLVMLAVGGAPPHAGAAGQPLS